MIRALHWKGVVALSPDTLRKDLFTETPSWKPWAKKPRFDPAVLEADVKRIPAVYRTAGYYEASARAGLDWSDDRSEVTITIEVHEGEPVWLAWWDVDLAALPGADEGAREALVAGLPLAPGTVFRVEDYGRAKQELLRRLAERGHPEATLEGGADVDVEHHSASVWWKVWPGPLVRVGEIRIRGLERVDESIVRRELAFAPGEVYDARKIQRTQRQLYDLDLFRWVMIQPDLAPAGGPYQSPDTEVRRDVAIEVAERPPRGIGLGLGYGTEDRVRVRASWIHRNLFGQARRFEVIGRASALGTSFEGRLRRPHFPEEHASLLVTSTLGLEDVPAYEARRFANHFGVERRFGEHWLAQAGYGLEWDDPTHVPSAAKALLEDPERRTRIGSLLFGLRRDTTNDPLDPTRGTRLSLSIEPAAVALGSQESFVRLVLEGRGYLPLSFPRAGSVLAGRLELGTIEPFAGTDAASIPVVRRFYAGGADSVRGFAFQHLGPPEAENEPVGGTSLLEASVELRVPIWRDLSGVAFVDAGQLSLDPFTWRLGDLRFAGGGGLRYKTPLGPIRFDVGRAFESGRSVQFFFSVGHAF